MGLWGRSLSIRAAGQPIAIAKGQFINFRSRSAKLIVRGFARNQEKYFLLATCKKQFYVNFFCYVKVGFYEI